MLIAGVAAAPGDSEAFDRVIERVYSELHAIASRQMAGEAAGHTLGATALANEAYMRLRGSKSGFESRAHFFAAASRAMRSILIDHARRRDAAKRGGKDLRRSPLDEHIEAMGHSAEHLLAVDEALTTIAGADESGRLVDVAHMWIFARMTAAQIGVALNVSPRTVERDVEFLRALLRRRFGL